MKTLPSPLSRLLLPAILLAGVADASPWVPESEALADVSEQRECTLDTALVLRCKGVRRTVLLKDEAKQDAGNVILRSDSRLTQTLKKAWVETPGGETIPVPESQIAQPGKASFEGKRRLSLAFPSLETGSRTVLETETVLVPAPHVAQFHYTLHYPATMNRIRSSVFHLRSAVPVMVKSRDADGIVDIERSADGRELTIRLRQPYFRYPALMEAATPWRATPRIEIATEDDPARTFAALASIWQERIDAGLPARARAEAERLAALPAGERLAGALRYLRNNYRYLGDWRLAEHGYAPEPLAQIEGQGYGDCKDLSAMLTGILRRAGLNADPVLVQMGSDNRPSLFIGAGSFNHAIVRVEEPGGVRWVDATSRRFSPDVPHWGIQNRFALALTADGARPATIPMVKPEQAHSRAVYDFYPEGRLWRVSAQLWMAAPQVEQLGELEEKMGRLQADKQLVDTQFVDLDVVSFVVKRDKVPVVNRGAYPVSFTGTLDPQAGFVGNDRYFNASMQSALVRGLKRVRRQGPAGDGYLGVPATQTSVLRWHGLRPRQPLLRCSADSPWLSFQASPLELAGGSALKIIVTRKTDWVPASGYQSAQMGRWLDQVDRCMDGLRVLFGRAPS
ncbi:DUF3857 domain-containing protein [Paludibacterium paludis]|uniref:DUF3857 domain-containing protein n=1 Tax=Paludibacterium paludis TaxID=1225769 RepID=A0A918P5R6_9NEIS|nr:DUF3857 domain-containing protein [Paludibacterium paludis]GGY27360.1 hypothetical protein GCM10011289_33480 [Paludibacterium paludis]